MAKKFKIYARSGYIVINDGDKEIWIGCKLNDAVIKAFNYAELMDKGYIKDREEIKVL